MAVSSTLAIIIVYAYQDLHFSAGQLGLALSLGSVPVLVGAALSRRISGRLEWADACPTCKEAAAVIDERWPVAMREGGRVQNTPPPDSEWPPF